MKQDELLLRCKDIVDGEDDSVYVFPMCDEDYRKVRIIGKPFDKKVVADEVKALFI